MSEKENVHLIATFFTAVDPKYNCATCLLKVKKDVREQKKACNQKSKEPVTKYHDIYNFYRCPSNFRLPSYRNLIKLHGLYLQGILPYNGGILEQPAKFIEAMNTIDALMAEHQKDLEAKQKWQTTKSRSNSRSKSKKP